MSAAVQLPALDPLQRYSIPESAGYLRVCVALLYQRIGKGEIRIIKDGKRTFVPGSEIARLSALPADSSSRSDAAERDARTTAA